MWSPANSVRVARDSGIGAALESGGHKIGGGGIPVRYKKLNIELIVVADEADAVVPELNAALDRLEEKWTLFGGGIEAVAFEHSGIRKRSALAHTIAAGETVAGAFRTECCPLRSHLMWTEATDIERAEKLGANGLVARSFSSGRKTES
jgi:hypothetical protein